MHRSVLSLGLVLLVVVAAVLLSLNGCGMSRTITNPPSPGKIQHVVVIFQENRTPDNLFQDPVLISHGADIVQSGLNSLGQAIPLGQSELGIDYDLNHAHAAFIAMYDSGNMDGADLILVTCNLGTTACPPNPQFKFVNPAEVAPYFQMAEQYTFGDRMFQTNQGPSFPAHQFIISGTSAPTATSSLFASGNPAGVMGSSNNTGCTAPSAEFVRLIDPAGAESSTQYPCFDHPTLTDLLDAKGLSWRYYTLNAGTVSGGSIWTGPNAIQHICQPTTVGGQLVCTGPEWKNNVIIDPTRVLTDVTNNQLAAVSWVIPSRNNSDHAGSVNAIGEPSWVASIVNAIGASPYWANTVIFVTWDDWGGWFDHVPPPQVLVNCAHWGCGYVYGFRVPLIVISPYAKAGFISHTPHDFGSILKFIEENFGLPSLGYADAPADDFSDCFNFNQTPITFQTINAPLHAEYFLNDKSPQLDPDDD